MQYSPESTCSQQANNLIFFSKFLSNREFEVLDTLSIIQLARGLLRVAIY
jgi:hypothetical protein